MPVVLVRIDDRLLHGQVTHGWAPVLLPALVVVADDAAVGNEWERETYLASGPETAEVRVLGLEATAGAFRQGEFERPRTLVLVRGPRELAILRGFGFPVGEVNVGGLHRSPGRRMVRSDLHVSAEEAEALSELIRDGVAVYWQPLPTDAPERLSDLDLGSGKETPG